MTNYLDYLGGDFDFKDYQEEEELTPLRPSYYKPADYATNSPFVLDLDSSSISLDPEDPYLLPPAEVDTTSVENKKTPLSFSDSTSELNETDLGSELPVGTSSENRRDFLRKNLSKIESDIASARNRINSDGKKLSTADMIGEVFTRALPIIVGAAFRGKQGAGMGADIATAQGLADIKRRNAIDAEARQGAIQELRNLGTQRNIFARELLSQKTPEEIAEERRLKLNDYEDRKKIDQKYLPPSQANASNQLVSEQESLLYAERGLKIPAGTSRATANNIIRLAERDKTGREGTLDLPDAVSRELDSGLKGIRLANNLAETLDSISSWGALQQATLFQGLDDKQVTAQLNDLISQVVKARSGLAVTDKERQFLEKIISGDRTSSPKQVAALLRSFAEREYKNYDSTIGFYSSSASKKPEDLLAYGEDVYRGVARNIRGIPDGAIRVRGKTVKGKPVYEQNGKYYVEE